MGVHGARAHAARARGLVLGQVLFAVGGLRSCTIRADRRVPVLRLAADVARTGYFLRLFAAAYGGMRVAVQPCAEPLQPCDRADDRFSHGFGLAELQLERWSSACCSDRLPWACYGADAYIRSRCCSACP